MSNTIQTTVQSMIDEVKAKYQGPVEADLENQILSKDPKELVRQLDQQAEHDKNRILGT